MNTIDNYRWNKINKTKKKHSVPQSFRIETDYLIDIDVYRFKFAEFTNFSPYESHLL